MEFPGKLSPAGSDKSRPICLHSLDAFCNKDASCIAPAALLHEPPPSNHTPTPPPPKPRTAPFLAVLAPLRRFCHALPVGHPAKDPPSERFRQPASPPNMPFYLVSACRRFPVTCVPPLARYLGVESGGLCLPDDDGRQQRLPRDQVGPAGHANAVEQQADPGSRLAGQAHADDTRGLA